MMVFLGRLAMHFWVRRDGTAKQNSRYMQVSRNAESAFGRK